jgi:hypothetical protein
LGAANVRKIHIIIATACLVLGAATAYAGQSGRARTPDNNSAGDQAVALMSKGNNWFATNILKKLVAKNNTPLNRFNLATGYQRTGRIRQAESIYRDLLIEGQRTNVMATPSKDAPGARIFNLADEAASRLIYFDWLKSENTRQAMARRSGQGPASAEAFGVEAAVTIGGPTSGDVSDETAMALDAQAGQGVAD